MDSSSRMKVESVVHDSVTGTFTDRPPAFELLGMAVMLSRWAHAQWANTVAAYEYGLKPRRALVPTLRCGSSAYSTVDGY